MNPYRPIHEETPEQRRIRALEEENRELTRRLIGVDSVVMRMRADYERHVRSEPPPWFVIAIAVGCAYLFVQAWDAMWGAF